MKLTIQAHASSLVRDRGSVRRKRRRRRLLVHVLADRQGYPKQSARREQGGLPGDHEARLAPGTARLRRRTGRGLVPADAGREVAVAGSRLAGSRGWMMRRSGRSPASMCARVTAGKGARRGLIAAVLNAARRAKAPALEAIPLMLIWRQAPRARAMPRPSPAPASDGCTPGAASPDHALRSERGRCGSAIQT
jgi:hypothetical protein